MSPQCLEITEKIILPLIAIVSAGIGGAFTIYIYYQNSKLQRSQWLYSLFEKFFFECRYTDIRQLLDYDEDTKDIERLKETVISHSDKQLEEKFVDYLNFFEFIASLEQLGQLPMREIQMMFDYYIRRLGDYEFVLDYLNDQSFEGLNALVAKVRATNKPQ